MSSSEKDYKETLFLPTTTFPMRANLPEREKEWLERWEELKIYKKLRLDSRNRKDFVLHDAHQAFTVTSMSHFNCPIHTR